MSVSMRRVPGVLSLRTRLLVGALLLSLGAATGMGAAWWQRRPALAEAALPAPGAGLPVQAHAAAFAGSPAPAPADRHGALGGAGIAQMDVAELLGASPRPSDWRLARLRGNPQVLVLEFPGLAEQGAALNRTAAFVEKAKAPRHRVLSDGELAQLIARQGDNAQTFYQGHDYLADQLARFFTVAEVQRQALNAQEARLLQLLLDKKVLARNGAAYAAQGLQALVTFTAVQPDDARTPLDETVDARRRESILLHELSHGLFFTSASYREHCWQFWRQRLSAEDRASFRRLLLRMHYDTDNEELVVNEMQALLMHTPDTRAFSAASLGITDQRLGEWQARFRQGWVAR